MSDYPRTMIHPAAVKGTTKAVTGKDPISGRPFTDYQGTPDRYPPVEVRDENEQGYYASKGYYPSDEPPPSAKSVVFAEYPKMMEHPDFQEAIQAQSQIVNPQGVVLQDKREPKPAKFAPVTVATRAEEDAWGKKGYVTKGTSDPDAVQRAAAMPYDPSRASPSEYPKMVDGVEVQDPGLDQPGFQEYPKWIGDKLVNNRTEERALVGEKPEDKAAIAQAKRAAALKAIADAQAQLDAADAELTGAPAPPLQVQAPAPAAPEVPPTANDRQALYAELTARGIEFSNRWPTDKLRKALEQRAA